jgi:hypothetical protein
VDLRQVDSPVAAPVAGGNGFQADRAATALGEQARMLLQQSDSAGADRAEAGDGDRERFRRRDARSFMGV